MRVARSLAVSVSLGLLAANACLRAPDSRDFGKNSLADGGTDSSTGDSSAGGSSGTGGGGSGGAGGKGDASAGGATGDGQAPDAGGCTLDADCDDHDICSGTEKCVSGTCAPGTPKANKTSCTVTVTVSGGSADGGSTAGGGSADGGTTAPGAGDGGPSIGTAPGLCFEGVCLQTCSSTADCDDHNPCTGQETCDGTRGVCVRGVPPKCDDSIDCTLDSCDPSNGACVNTLIDQDGDGHAPDTLGACGDDCDDTNPTTYKGAAELCDLKDNDCDGQPETNQPFWYIDCDSDGFAPPGTQYAVQQCDQPANPPAVCGGIGTWTTRAPTAPDTQDCNDGNASLFPGNPEVCDGFDNDCSGIADDVAPKQWPDCDGDYYAAYGTQPQWGCVTTSPPASCSGGTGYWTPQEPVAGFYDCDDSNSSISPSGYEDCTTSDGIDNNCDGYADAYVWYPDCDGDYYAATTATAYTAVSCPTPQGAPSSCPMGTGQWITTYPQGKNADCDDANALVYPYAGYQTTQDPTHGWDYNCDGQVSKQYTTSRVDPAGACVANFFFCSGDYGWEGADVPDCGQAATYTDCYCTSNSGGYPFYFCNACGREEISVTQGCN